MIGAMTKPMEYKGYQARLVFDPDIEMFRGEVLGINANVDFYADSVAALRVEFAKSVDAYLEVCAEKGITPEKSFSGNLNLRLGPSVHAIASLRASHLELSLNTHIRQLVLKDAEESGMAIPVEMADMENRRTR